MVKMSVIGGPEAVAWARNAAGAMARAIEQGLRKGAAIVASNAKRLVYAGHPEHLQGDTGHARQAITYQVHGAAYAEIGTNVRYMKIQEYGGTITARGKALAIPMPGVKGEPGGKALDWAPGGGDRGRLVDRSDTKGSEATAAGGRTQYLLVSEVTIPARPTFGPAMEQSREAVRAAFTDEVRKGMGQAAS